MRLNVVSRLWTLHGSLLIDVNGVPNDLKLWVQWPRGYTGEL